MFAAVLLVLPLLLCAATGLRAQADTGRVYFDSDWAPCEEDAATYYRVWHRVSDTSFLVRDYFRVGDLQMKGYAHRPLDSLGRFGLYTYYYEDGTKSYEGEYVGDRQAGLWYSWHPNGTLRDSAWYADDSVRGLRRTWHDNGAVAMEVVYVNGLENGPVRVWHPNGVLSDSGGMAAGKRDGRWRTWYPNGTLRADGYYRADSLDGVWAYWYPGGERSDSGAYVGGQREGIWTSWYPSGRMLSRGAYHEGERDSAWVWWHTNHTIRLAGNYASGARVGQWKEFFRDGVVGGTATYRPGSLLAEWTYFHRGGRTSGRESFRHDTERIAGKYWSKDSTLLRSARLSARKARPLLNAAELDRLIRVTARYPDAARAAGAEGTVVIAVWVQEDGVPDEYHVAVGVHPALDAEALRVVRTIRAWIPCKEHNRIADGWARVPVRFRPYSAGLGLEESRDNEADN